MARGDSTNSNLTTSLSLSEQNKLPTQKQNNLNQGQSGMMLTSSATKAHSRLDISQENQKNGNKQYPVEALLQKAKEFSDEYLDEMALKFYEKAYEQEPLNQLVLDSYSEFLVNWSKQQQQNGEFPSAYHIERCKFLLRESIRLDSFDVNIEEEECKQVGGCNNTNSFPDEASIQKLNPSKYLYLAQLQVGGDALKSYEEGIKKMKILHDYTSQKLKQAYLGEKDKISNKTKREEMIEIEGVNNDSNIIVSTDTDDEMLEYDDDENTLKIMKYQICNAYCSMCDIYMTDLCYEDNAEEMCITYVTEASSYDVGAVEYLSTLASLRLSQSNNEEAVMYLLEAYKRIKYIYKELQSNESLSQPDAEFLEMITPSIESKVSLAKMLLEAAQLVPGKACARKAGNILYLCRMENDTDPEIMFLMGVALFTMNPPDYEASLEILNLARATLEKQQKETEQIQKRRSKLPSKSSLVQEEEEEEEAEDLEGELSALIAQLDLVQKQIILVQDTMQMGNKLHGEKLENEDELSDDDFDFGLCMYEAPNLEEGDDDGDDDELMEEEENV